jgi:hypothetical protein
MQKVNILNASFCIQFYFWLFLFSSTDVLI